nr:hypothetical protein [Mesorhizobium qingshengii]
MKTSIRCSGKFRHLQRFPDPLFALGARNEVEPRGQQQVLVAGQRPVGRKQLRHITDVGTNAPCLAPQVVSRDRGTATRWRQQGRQHLDQCCFSRAIGADQAEDLSLAHLQINAVDNHVLIERLRKAMRFYG